jgi:hypothetical protein
MVSRCCSESQRVAAPGELVGGVDAGDRISERSRIAAQKIRDLKGFVEARGQGGLPPLNI